MRYRVEFGVPVAAAPASMPALTRSAVGELLCAFSTRWEPFPRGGELQLVRSADAGRTWSRPETLWRCPDPRVTINCCVGMATLRDGTVLLPALYSLVPRKAEPPGAEVGGEAGVIGMYELGDLGANRRHIHCLRSGDHGQTWTNIAVGGPPPGGGIMRFGRLIERQNGELLLPAYTYFSMAAESEGTPGFFRSPDKGWTWGPFEPVPVGWTSEMNLLERRDGTWLALIRDLPGPQRRIFGMSCSPDAGRTWAPVWSTGVQGKMPDLWEAEDGRLLLVVGCEGNYKGFEIYRKRERRTFNVLFSSGDGGRTWQRELELPPLDEHTQAIPADEPAMVPLGDGRYYVVSQLIDRGEGRQSHPADWDYYFSLQGNLLAPV